MLKVKTFFELSQMDVIDIININQICLYEGEVLYFLMIILLRIRRTIMFLQRIINISLIKE